RLRTVEGMKVAKAKGRLKGKQPKLDRLRSIADQMGEKLNLVGSRRITSGLFAALIKEAHRHGR
ncbi:MAG: hypothetical protein WAT47_07155, partial [Nostocoides sp.]